MLVVGFVVRHHYGRWTIKTANQQASHVVQGRIDRAPHESKALLSEPLARSVKELRRDGGIVDTFKKTKETNVIIVFLQVHAIFNGRNPANDLSISVLRQEQTHVTVLKESIFLWIDQV